MENKSEQISPQNDSFETEDEKEAYENSGAVFDRIYNRLKEDNKNNSTFVKYIARQFHDHYKKIGDKEGKDLVEDLRQKANTYKVFNPDAEELADQVFEDFRLNTLNLVQSKEVSLITAKMFLANFDNLNEMSDWNGFYESLVKTSDLSSPEEDARYQDTAKKVFDKYPDNKKSQQGNSFYHFNGDSQRAGNSDIRLYICADVTKSPTDVVGYWWQALRETGLKDKLYFKVPTKINKGGKSRLDSIVIFPTKNISDEEIKSAIKAFSEKCPKELLNADGMPAAIKIEDGISIAAEPKYLNNLMKITYEQHYRNAGKLSYNSFVAGLTQLSLELAYGKSEKDGSPATKPKELRDSAKKYFEQLLKLSNINTETMMPN